MSHVLNHAYTYTVAILHLVGYTVPTKKSTLKIIDLERLYIHLTLIYP